MHLHREILQLPIFESASQVKYIFHIFHCNSTFISTQIKLSTFSFDRTVTGMPQITFTSYKSQFLCTRRVSNTQRWRFALHLLYFQRFDGSNAKWNGRCYIGYVTRLSLQLFATVLLCTFFYQQVKLISMPIRRNWQIK